mgnify:CR=1 FL=1
MSLVIAGEAIFLLPFVIPRIFRPTFLDIFEISNLQLGTAFSLYGMIAMASYFAGGPLADRFSARRLLVAALLSTALGGLVLASIPSITLLIILYGFWGLSSIFLFWAALIKTTRDLGNSSQGQAFGLLDGGRGLFAALLSSLSVLIFAALLPQDVDTASFAERSEAFSSIILVFTGFGVLSALLVWFFIPESSVAEQPQTTSAPIANIQLLKQVASMPTVWLQALIILCAYVGYKSVDDFSLYASEAFGYNDVEAAQVSTLAFWMRPLAAIATGLLADKLGSMLVLLVSFLIIMIGCLVIATGMIVPGVPWMLLLTIAGTSAGIYGVRGIYFAIFGEAHVPLASTGTAVGLVSFIGFTPDIFMGPLMGYLLDSSPGATGHQHFFFVVFLFGLLGFFATLMFKYAEGLLNKQKILTSA